MRWYFILAPICIFLNITDRMHSSHLLAFWVFSHGDLSYSLCLSLTWIVFIFLCSRHSLSMLHNSPICYLVSKLSPSVTHTFSLCFFISFDIEIFIFTTVHFINLWLYSFVFHFLKKFSILYFCWCFQYCVLKTDQFCLSWKFLTQIELILE